MFNKLTLAAGFGAGYVLGAKAGKERYYEIEAKFREIAGMPAVQQATATVKETAADLADTAKATVSDTVASAKDKASGSTPAASEPVIDLASTPAGAPTAARTTSTSASPVTASPVPPSPVTTGSTAPRPMAPGAAGAAPSVTAPVV